MLSAALLAFALAAPPPDPVVLWPGGAPGEPGGVGPEKEQPAKGDNISRLTDVTEPTVTLYKPPADKDTGACVLICPGGGYNILAWNLEGTEVAEWLNTLGVSGAVLKYRVPARKNEPRGAGPLQDAQRALGMLRHRAKEFGLDPAKIGVLGFSAGGHLAARLSTDNAVRSYPAIDDADKVSCRPDFTVLIYPAYLVPKGDTKLAPDIKVAADTPKTFVAMTADDGVGVEGPLAYYLALKQAKVPAEMHLYAKGGHGYGLRPSANAIATWPARCGEWLRGLGVLELPKPSTSTSTKD